MTIVDLVPVTDIKDRLNKAFWRGVFTAWGTMLVALWVLG